MAQVWFTFLLLVMIVGVVISDGNERRNTAMVGIFAVIGLFATTRQKRR
jgi:hypothetical protein